MIYLFIQEICKTAKIHLCFGLLTCLKVEKPVQGKPYNVEVTNVSKPSREEDQSAEIQQKENNNNQEETGKDSNENCSMYNLQSNWEMQIGAYVFWVY